jgi:hypothetical protein
MKMRNQIKLALVLGSALTAGLWGCSDDDGTNPDASVADSGVRDTGVDAGVAFTCPTWAGTQPEGTVALNFTIDDSANQTYTSTDGLAWKGSMNYDSATRCITRDPSWGGGTGPYALLYDDGPWSAGGHEPAGATAGDNIFGVTVFFPIPADDAAFEYGAVRNWTTGQQGEWIWNRPMNGTFTVPAGAATPVTATGLVIEPFGTIDVRFVIDTSTLAPEFSAVDPAQGINIKSAAWGWVELEMRDDGMAGDDTAGDDIFTLRMSDVVGRDPIRNAGLVKTGDEPEFVFTFGPIPGLEYKVAGAAARAGVTVLVRAQGANDWTTVAVANRPMGDQNTFVVIP